MAAAVEIPKQYKAAVYDQPGKVSTKIETLDTPEPGSGEVLINLTHSGVCHSDFGIMMNSWPHLPVPTPAGQVGGHEGVGVIVKLGPGTGSSPVSVGDRVGIKWLASACGGCPACLGGHDGVCFNQKISGYFTPGTFQQYAIGPAHYVTPIPDGLDSAAAAPMLCAGVTVYSALRKSQAKSGEWVVILGAGGGLGHLACQIASRGMAMRVIGVDAPSKEQLAMDSGAEHFIPVGDAKKTEGKIKELTGGFGAHAVIVCTASNAAYAGACDLLRFGGHLMVVGVPEGEMVPIGSAKPQMIIAKEITIRGVAVGDRRDAIECLDLAARGLISTHFRIEKLDQLTEVFKEMEEAKLQGRVVLDLS